MASLEDLANEWTDWQNTRQDQHTLDEPELTPWTDAGPSSNEEKPVTEPKAKRIVICQLCRKRLMQVRNGEWYHERGSSVFCDHTDGTHRKAIPLEINAR